MEEDFQKTVRYVEKKEMPAGLLILEKNGKIRRAEVGQHCLIGRRYQGNPADVQLNSGLVSRRHGEIQCMRGEYYYQDLESTNGTNINGVLLGKDSPNGNQTVKLRNGDVLRIGFEGGSGDYDQTVVMVFVTDCAPDTVWESQVLDDHVEELNIGRSKTDIMLDNAMVSKNHASFFRARRGWAVIDHNSTNGVFLNGLRIAKPMYLYPMDVVRIANLCFFYDGARIWYPVATAKGNKKPSGGSGNGAEVKRANAGGEELVIRITERSVWQGFKKLTLLQDINLTVHDGEMVLILGGSGAGKTTFMNAVMGYEKAKGTIVHGGTDIYTEYEKMKYEIGFVPQQDLLRGSDTAYDTLRNAATMKLPKGISAEKREQRIEEMLELLGLQREATSMVSKLSGGQRKRLSIAVEFIAGPGLFFLDEPDSGLDGVMAKELMNNLRAIADSGKIVMVITHGPDRAAELFDKVIVLAKSVKDNCGHLAFFGSVDEAYRFFETDSLEGVVKRINRPDEGGDGKSDYYIEKYKKSYM